MANLREQQPGAKKTDCIAQIKAAGSQHFGGAIFDFRLDP